VFRSQALTQRSSTSLAELLARRAVARLGGSDGGLLTPAQAAALPPSSSQRAASRSMSPANSAFGQRPAFDLRAPDRRVRGAAEHRCQRRDRCRPAQSVFAYCSHELNSWHLEARPKRKTPRVSRAFERYRYRDSNSDLRRRENDVPVPRARQSSQHPRKSSSSPGRSPLSPRKSIRPPPTRHGRFVPDWFRKPARIVPKLRACEAAHSE
jgi:hypothetical protein